MTKSLFIIAALSLALAVALAAVGAHAVGGEEARRIWQTASFWHVAHTLGLMGLAGAWPRLNRRLGAAAAVTVLIGALAFCGALYGQAVLEAPPVAMLAPAGGMLSIIGWLMAALAALRGPEKNT